MKKNVTRRDFCNGILVAGGVNTFGCSNLFGKDGFLYKGSNKLFTDYPPMLSGMRGNHEGSYEVAHALVWNNQKPSSYIDLNEEYDLVIVGAGISGLTAAKFYQNKRGPKSRILLLDNHDDFGGHAKRNEFDQDGRTLLGLGGSVNLDNPNDYSQIAKSLLKELGINLDLMRKNISDDFPMSNPLADNVLAIPGPDGHVISEGNWMLTAQGIGDIEATIQSLNLDSNEKKKLIQFISGEVDYLDDLTLLQKHEYIYSTSYHQFLTLRVGLKEDTANIFYSMIRLIWGVDGKHVNIMDAISLGAPGLQSMGGVAKIFKYILQKADDSESLYFPDGNASVARLLVKKLIPAVTTDKVSFDNISTSVFNYKKLDRYEHSVRLRLNSTVVGVKESGNGSVNVDYIKNGEAFRVKSKHSILACYNSIIPHLCPELPESQKEAIRYAEKMPLVWANVHLSDGLSFSKIGAKLIQCPNDPFDVVTVSPPTTTGGYQPPTKPEDPVVLFLMSIPKFQVNTKDSPRDIYKKGRQIIYATSFETYEKQIRSQLESLMGNHGFKQSDILAITVNRWPHGYAYEYSGLHDPEWKEGQAPHEIGRAQFGKISIANSDSEAYAYVNAAIDSAWRAVEEQTS